MFFRIFSLIQKHGPISRKDLSNISDYSSATISNHVNRLLKKLFNRNCKRSLNWWKETCIFKNKI
ncbi:MAG: winged helix-turn-helix domain-containing protein [bacterium]